MRGFRLNGWQRIGIVLSLAWLPVGYFWALHMMYGPLEATHRECLTSGVDLSVCYRLRNQEVASTREHELAEVA